MPTIALNNAVSYSVLTQRRLDIVQTFPPICVWGTIGFIAAMWTVDLVGWSRSALQLYVGAGAALLLGPFAFTMPECPPTKPHGARSLMTSGWVVDHFTVKGVKEWPSIWPAFAGYALIPSVIFPMVFRYRHDPGPTTPVFGRA